MKKSCSLLLTLILLAFGMVLLNCGSDSHPASNVQPPPPPPAQSGDIAFMQEIVGQSFIFTPMLGKFTVNGENVQFSATPVKDPSNGQAVAAEFMSFVLSQDHTKAAVDLYGGLDGNSGQWDIWVGNVADASMKQISNDPYNDLLPQFSPDGTKVVYASFRPTSSTQREQWQIVIRNADGSDGEQVLPIPVNVVLQMHPTYSPDSSKLVVDVLGYGPNNAEFQGIWIMNADGSNPQMLTNPAQSESCSLCVDLNPTFSGDGSKIAFSRVDNGMMIEDIYVMNTDGSGVTKLTDGTGLNSDPMFVKIDGTERLLFSSNRDNLNVNTSSGFEIYSMKMDGTGITRLTNNSLFDAFYAQWYQLGLGLARQEPAPSLFHQHHTGTVHW